MYCAHCGKKNSETMLFCGFCGRPLGTRDGAREDDLERALFGRPQREAEPEPDVPAERSAPGEVPAAEGSEAAEDIPEIELSLPPRAARPIPARVTPPRPSRQPAEDLPEDAFSMPILQEPVELRVKRPPTLTRSAGAARPFRPVRPGAVGGGRNPNTIVPPREASFDDIFMEDGPGGYDDDDFDDEDEYRAKAPRQSFFVRHIRGIVSLLLLAITVAIVGYWLMFGQGQRVLGQLYISGNPATYVSLGDEAEAAGATEVAGAYFLKALELDPGNRGYAIKAANAYIMAENTGKASSAIEKLIEMNPDEADPYVALQSLYPDPAARPQKVAQLIRQGFERTGDARLQQ